MDSAPRKEPPPEQDRRSLIILVLLIFFGMGVGLGLVRVLTREPAKVVHLAPPPMATREEEEPVDDEEDRLFKTAAPEDLPYQDFAGALGLEPTPDTAREMKAFGKSVLQHPTLRAEVEKCKKTNKKGKRCLARELLKRLERDEKFEQVASQYAFQPGFTEALMAVVQGSKGQDMAAVAKAVGAVPDKELAEIILKKKPMKRQMRANVSTQIATLAAMLLEAQKLAKSTDTVGGLKPENDAKVDAHQVNVDLSGLDDATTRRILRLLEVYPWLAPLGVPNLRRLEEKAPEHGLYGACFSLLLHFECWDACRKDPTGKCASDNLTWNPWDACHDWKGTGEPSDKVCISRCMYQKPCVVPPPVWTKYCVCRPGCCGKGGCGCCLSPYHSHAFCKPMWEGDILTDLGNAPLPPELFYPACTSHGEGAAHCDCCYDKDGKFSYDVRDPHGVFGSPVQSSDGSACGGSCEGCGPRGCLKPGGGSTQTQRRAGGSGDADMRAKLQQLITAVVQEAAKTAPDAPLSIAEGKADPAAAASAPAEAIKSGPSPAKVEVRGPTGKAEARRPAASPAAVTATAVGPASTAKPTSVQASGSQGGGGSAGGGRFTLPAFNASGQAPERRKSDARPVAKKAAAEAAQGSAVIPETPADSGQQPAESDDEEPLEEDPDMLSSKPLMIGQAQEPKDSSARREGSDQWVRRDRRGEDRKNHWALILAGIGLCGFIGLMYRLNQLGYFNIGNEE